MRERERERERERVRREEKEGGRKGGEGCISHVLFTLLRIIITNRGICYMCTCISTCTFIIIHLCTCTLYMCLHVHV